MTELMLYLAGTLLRGLLVFAGAILMERFGARLLTRSGRLIYYYLLLAILVCPIPGIDYPVFTKTETATPSEILPISMVQPEEIAAPAPPAVAPAVSKPELVFPQPAGNPAIAPSAPAKFEWPPMSVLFFYLWLAGAGVLAIRKLIIGIIWTRRIGRLKPVTDTRITSIWNKLPGRTKIVLLDSDPLELGPCCFGLLKPRVLFPVSLAQTISDDQLQMLLTHEFEHIRRRDMLQISLRELLKIPLFFNPFLRYLLKRLNCATELACDAAVVRVLQLKPESQRSYGKLLLNLASAPHSKMIVTAPGIRSGANDLKLRLREVVSGNRFSWRHTAMLSLSLAMIGGVCMLIPACASKPEAAVEYRVIEGEFTLTLDLGQTVPVTSKYQYLSCVDANGKAVPSAGNIIFYSPWLGEKEPFKDKNNRYYAEKLGWTVFAIPDMQYTDAKMILAGQDKITQLLDLKPSKLLMYGGSSGATNSINASLLHPERFDAVAAHSSRRWYPDEQGFTKKDSVVRLLTNNWYDGAGNEGVAILDDLKKLGMEGIYIETPPNWKQVTSPFFHRSPNDFSQALYHQFFKDIVKLRDANGGVVPPMKKWPVKIKKADGRVFYLPGKNLQAVYQTLPTDLVGKSAESRPLFYPALSGKPAGTVLFLLDSEFQSQMKLLDLIYYFATKGNVDVYALESTDPQAIYLPAVKCLDSLKSDLPVYVVGLSRAGGSAVLAAVNSKNPQIAKVSTIGTDYNRSTVAEASKKPNLPVVMYYDATIASNDTEGSIIGVNVDARLGFGSKIFEVLDESVKPGAVKPVKSTKPRPVNRLPELAAEVRSLKEKIHSDKPETAKAYADKLENLCAEADKLEKVSMIDLTRVYQFREELGEAKLEYADQLNPGKSQEELNRHRIEILDNLGKVYHKHTQLLRSRYNAGYTIDRDEQQNLYERYFKVIEKLKQLRESQTSTI